MKNCETCAQGCNCPRTRFGRREFLTTLGVGVSALTMKSGLLDFASTVMADPPKPAGRPKVQVVFFRPKKHDAYWMSWPGHTYDVAAAQGIYIKQMTEAANRFGVELQVNVEPLEDAAAVSGFLGQLKKHPPQGVVAVLMHMSWWGHVNTFVQGKGDLPAVVFAPLGMSFTGHLAATRTAPKTFVASTQDVQWLTQAIRMFKTLWTMKNTRACILAGDKTRDEVLPTVGTTLHYVPRERWPQEFDKTETTDEMRAIAAYYTKEAKRIVEPKPQDVLNAAKNYVVAKRIMAAENCQTISLDCLPLVASGRIPCPPCIAWSRLLDEGSVGTCEADRMAAISQLLTAQLLGRPGFMQDPVPNTVTNSFMGAHCTSPMKLAGFDKPHFPFELRNHDESGTGCVPAVLWPVGERVTLMKFESPGTIILGTGRILGNNTDLPGCGGCRTSVDCAMDNVADCRDMKGFHQLFILGKQDQHFKAYAQMAGLKVLPIG
ncbi:MAG: hypothetical protein ACLQNE_41225 [Thermoguttaceae bacterium]